jgi:hypothetical protein
MKARVKETGYIVDVELYYITPRIKTYTDGSQYYKGDELDFNVEYADQNYWTRLEHQAAIAAMGGMCGNTKYNDYAWVDMAKFAIKTAHALVEKLKEKEK